MQTSWTFQWLIKPNTACLHLPLPEWTWLFCLPVTVCKSVSYMRGHLARPGQLSNSHSPGYSDCIQLESPFLVCNIQIMGMKLSSSRSLGWDSIDCHLSYYLNLQDGRMKSIAQWKQSQEVETESPTNNSPTSKSYSWHMPSYTLFPTVTWTNKFPSD